jgi:hypothetical protein
MIAALRVARIALVAAGLVAMPAWAQTVPAPPQPVPPRSGPSVPEQPPASNRYSPDELVDAGHHFFGGVSRGLATIVEKAVSQWGQPNGYVLGEEAGGAFVGGLRYGDGTLYTKNAGDVRVFWQGPTMGFDLGADGARTMMLVYNLPRTEAIFERFGGIEGSAYFVGGLGMTALGANDIVVVPIRAGVGLRLGANLGYLKFTARPTWNPF